jgi:hypothetical protein
MEYLSSWMSGLSPENFLRSLSVAVALRYPAKMIQENDWQAPWHR